jgi:hypothetical protein
VIFDSTEQNRSTSATKGLLRASSADPELLFSRLRIDEMLTYYKSEKKNTPKDNKLADLWSVEVNTAG